MPAEHRLALTAGLRAPSDARAWVSARTPELPRDAVDDTLLVVSELVTNAVRHGQTEVVLTLELQPDRVRVSVHDDSDILPIVPRDHPSVDRSTGRGLLIVAATATDWGITRDQGSAGKTVWAELALVDQNR